MSFSLNHSDQSSSFIDHPDTDSDGDVYGQRRFAPSAESLGQPRFNYRDSSTPTLNYDFQPSSGIPEAYPAWSAERQVPLSKEEIEDIFLDLTQKFGFQRDSMRNMVHKPILVISQAFPLMFHVTV